MSRPHHARRGSTLAWISQTIRIPRRSRALWTVVRECSPPAAGLWRKGGEVVVAQQTSSASAIARREAESGSRCRCRAARKRLGVRPVIEGVAVAPVGGRGNKHAKLEGTSRRRGPEPWRSGQLSAFGQRGGGDRAAGVEMNALAGPHATPLSVRPAGPRRPWAARDRAG